MVTFTVGRMFGEVFSKLVNAFKIYTSIYKWDPA